MRDPYSVLGVKRDAGADEIKTAWRTIAKAVHPDQNREDPNATQRFAEIGQAYDVLKDPKKRSRYDQRVKMAETKKKEDTILQQREAARQAAERAKAAKANAEKVMAELARDTAAKAKAHPQQGQPAGAESAEDVISRIFGAQAAAAQGAQPAATGERPAETRGQHADVSAADTAYQEHAVKVPLPVQAVELISSLVRRIRGVQPAPEKAPDIAVGVSVSVTDLLKENWITVALPEGREVRLQLEPGATDGQVVRLKGQGLKLQGMQRGDVAVTLRVDQSGPFRVEGTDIHTILPVSLENAVLGCQMTAESPVGPVDVTVPAWSGSDQRIRVVGGGLPGASGGRGDLVVEVRLMLWAKPDEKVTDLMRSMREGLFL